ncbi:MAG: succinyl-diaminopimelate desuccinylase [Verrucomicrobiota bacterium]
MADVVSFAVELAQQLIRENTINPPGHETRCVSILKPILSRAGFFLEERSFGDGRSSLIARIPGASRNSDALAFTGHVDTVPLGVEEWTVDPFGAEIRDGRLYGRGSCDMKAGIAAFISACIQKRDQLTSGSGALLIITAAEETGCEGAFALMKESALQEGARALIVAEPTDNYPLIGHKGALWLNASAKGVTAHGSMPEKGVNAIVKAVKAASRLDRFRLNCPCHSVLGAPTLNIGTFKGGQNINSVPDAAEFTIDIRTVAGQSHDGVCSALEGLFGEEIRLERILDVGAVWSDPEDPFIKIVIQVMEQVLGEKYETRAATYFTDAAFLKPALGDVPTVVLGPGHPSMAHQTDEYCSVTRIDQAVDAYIKVIDATEHLVNR